MANNRLSTDLERLAREKGLISDTPPKRKLPAVTSVNAAASRSTFRLSASFEVPVKVVSEMNQRCHWSVQRKRFDQQKDAIDAAFFPVQAVFQAFTHWRAKNAGGRYHVTFTRIGKKRLDDDNLNGAFKACRDRVAWWLMADDGSEAFHWSYGQEVSDECGIRIDITTEVPGDTGG